MAEPVITLRDVRKVYRLYAGSGYRFLDLFGLLGDRPGAYTEHAALDGVSLTISRGEKVAIIGRNGAGKSTLLKLITRVIEPTSGTLEVTGKLNALLQIGSGFHPDFTGRENVYAYLAQLGVTGREADRKYADIVEFAELEEYILQPVKTYSTGMSVRLMFSTATAITPELLVLDEVLGVGDAYFAQKSYERMRELTSGAGTTLLLVTHDIYSALKICERLIWVDRGRVLMDGAGPVVIKAYEDSVRQQEEHRLRAKKFQRADRPAAAKASTRVLVELQARHNLPPPCPLYVGAIEFKAGGKVASVPLGENAFDASLPAHLHKDPPRWGPIETWKGRDARAFLNHGSPSHKASGEIVLPGDDALERCEVRIAYASEQPCEVQARLFVNSAVIELGQLPPSSGEWVEHVVTVPGRAERAAASAGNAVNVTGVNGTGAVVIEDAWLANAKGDEAHIVEHGEPVSFHIKFRIADRSLKERPQVVVAIHRDGVLGACRFVARNLQFDGGFESGEVTLSLDRMMLGIGEYAVSVMIAAEGYLDRDQVVFYSLNNEVYASLSRAFEFKVIGKGLTPTNTVFVGDGNWSLAKDQAVRPQV